MSKPIWLAVLLLLVACPAVKPVVSKGISGTVTIAGTGTQGLGNPQGLDAADIVPGEVLVTFKSDLGARSLSSLSVNDISLRSVRTSGLARTSLYRSDTARSVSETLSLVKELQARPDIAWAEPNQILHARLKPSDPAYLDGSQWHYDAIKLPQAWELETGGTNPVTVAVLDSGLLTKHPDIQGKFWDGYDFVSNAQLSNDGDGRDANADDPGDNPGGQGSYHGSHVAGTIAALTNNAQGVAGISWGAKILPVRVLGNAGSGSVSDIIDGMFWAAGIPVSGVPVNAHPAQVINISLGAKGLCRSGSSLQRAFDQVNAKGVIIVVAAGNENVEAAETIPASCSGVITVGATTRPTASNPIGTRAAYSNFGPRVDVMAPGGRGDDNQNVIDEVLSLDKQDGPGGGFGYGYKQGTSMAAPHVAGVIALLKSRDPNLGFSRALSILKRTARPLTDAQCTDQGTKKLQVDCGAGLIDAFAALSELNINPDFSLGLNPSSVIAERGQTVQLQITQSNFNGFATTAIPKLFKSISGLSLSVGPANANGNRTLGLTVPSSVPLGIYPISFGGSVPGLTREVSLSLKVVASNAELSPTENVADTEIVFCRDRKDGKCDVYTTLVTQSGNSAEYNSQDLPDGDYGVWACKDINNDNKDPEGKKDYRCRVGDLYGEYIVGDGLVRPAETGIDLDLGIVTSVNPTGTLTTSRGVFQLKGWLPVQ